MSTSLKANKKVLSKTKREMSSLKVNFKELESKKGASSDNEEPQEDAGNQFGGRKSKKNR
jgi:hypothetical protein